MVLGVAQGIGVRDGHDLPPSRDVKERCDCDVEGVGAPGNGRKSRQAAANTTKDWKTAEAF